MTTNYSVSRPHGSIDPKPMRIAVVGSGSGIIGRKLGLALLAAMPAIMVSPYHHSALPSMPAPKPAKRLSAADLARIEKAEAKRQRRVERNRKQGGAA
ncbi:hypothetical protein [Pseudomonas sp. Ga0074129]|uniref:hypothetical protein n=1 Tax=Pseudomonas sp. Ga0074129 TaxID=1752219 RepID=UPI000B124519|nr:hypothetical protein [Pseudomonas sp. Ga0074129]